MTAIVAYWNTEAREAATLVADRIAFEGPTPALTTKIFTREDFTFAIVGANPSFAIAKANTLEDLIAALEEQRGTGAIILADCWIMTYNPFNDQEKAPKVQIHLDDEPVIMGCYRGEVQHAINSGLTEQAAVRLVHKLWNCDEDVNWLTFHFETKSVVHAHFPQLK